MLVKWAVLVGEQPVWCYTYWAGLALLLVEDLIYSRFEYFNLFSNAQIYQTYNLTHL
jgi:hypothetical protein